MKPITTHLDRTPSGRWENREEIYAVGVLNLTREEAGEIEGFARWLERKRASKPLFICRNGHPLSNQNEWCTKCARDDLQKERREQATKIARGITLADLEAVEVEKALTPSGNRFSGLDIE